MCVLYPLGWHLLFYFKVASLWTPILCLETLKPFLSWWEWRQGSGRLEETCVLRMLAARVRHITKAKTMKSSWLELWVWQECLLRFPPALEMTAASGAPWQSWQPNLESGSLVLSLQWWWHCNGSDLSVLSASLGFCQLLELVLSPFQWVPWTLSSF